jgi:hypothetical protein
MNVLNWFRPNTETRASSEQPGAQVVVSPREQVALWRWVPAMDCQPIAMLMGPSREDIVITASQPESVTVFSTQLDQAIVRLPSGDTVLGEDRALLINIRDRVLTSWNAYRGIHA